MFTEYYITRVFCFFTLFLDTKVSTCIFKFHMVILKIQDNKHRHFEKTQTPQHVLNVHIISCFMQYFICIF